jgi:hypothetical protein
MFGYGGRMSTKRQLEIAHLTGIGAGLQRRYRDGETRDQVLEEIHEVTTDPDVLAEAAAHFRATSRIGGPTRWDVNAEQLLVDAGADVDAIGRHVIAHSNRGGFDLGGLGERAARLAPNAAVAARKVLPASPDPG